MNFKDKICVVTGGAGGIGLCIVNEFAKKGAKVAFIDLDKAAGEKALAIEEENIAEANSKKSFLLLTHLWTWYNIYKFVVLSFDEIMLYYYIDKSQIKV